ncbi:MAG: hypothetical protein ACXW19_05075 [Thermoanaerobaculia bacterium]
MFDPRYRKWIGPFAISALFIALAAYAQPPGALSFERNAGQTDARVRFLARTSGAVVFLTPAGVTTSMAR